MKGLLIVPLLWMHDNSWATTPVSTSKLRRMRPQYLICTTKTQGLVFERWWMPLLCMFWHLPADLSTEHVNSAVQAAHKSTLESHHGHWRAYLYTCPHNHNSPRDDCCSVYRLCSSHCCPDGWCSSVLLRCQSSALRHASSSSVDAASITASASVRDANASIDASRARVISAASLPASSL